MSHHNYCLNLTHQESGFTIVEVIVSMLLIGVITTTFWTFSNTSIVQYLNLQESSSSFGDLANKTQRIASVVRGLTDIVSVSADELKMYAYFFPNDTYVSEVRYYLNPAKTTLYADVTPMTANPPIGSPITAQLKTYTIVPKYYSESSVHLFDYKDASGNTLSLPITDLDTIKNIQINLATSPAVSIGSASTQRMSISISLRNRKTNL